MLAALPIILPLLFGALLFILKIKSRRVRNAYVFAVTVINAVICFLVMIYLKNNVVVLFNLTENLDISFKIDDAGCIFAGLVSVLWPLASLYAFEYMEHEVRQTSFFAFYTMTLGVVIGIAFAEDILTMYVFYEVLTLVTFPLVMHPMTAEAMKASRTYLCYSLGGAAFAFVGIIFIMNYGETLDFTYGGVMGAQDEGNIALLLFVFIVAFCGFSVKAAMFPFSRWIIKAAVAPTPVTALLHAVAVVKAGAFATIRLSYYIFGADFIRGTWAQAVVMVLTVITILYGSGMAVKERHFKRRMAYSTISNLSYILFSVTLMTPMGLVGAFTHLLMHAVIKICSFYCVGSVMHKTGKNYIDELDGLGRRMKATFACFTVSALALTGIPPLSGFISKWRIAEAAIDSGSVLSYIGIGSIIVSALLTAIYMISIIIRAYFPQENKVCDNFEAAHDPGICMKLPVIIFAGATVIMGIFWKPVIGMIENIIM